MDVKEREKRRNLTDAEKRRLENFNELCDDMAHQGYRQTELTVSIVKANIFAIVLLIPVLIIGIGLFVWRNGWGDLVNITGRELVVFIIGMFIMTVLHEFVHGFVWGLYSEHYFKDIEFGFMRQYLTPYCTCTMPLKKNAYIAGALMPLIALGILPLIAAIINGSGLMLWLGIIMTDAAAGDIQIVYGLLRYRSEAREMLCLDHPTMAGLVVFER